MTGEEIEKGLNCCATVVAGMFGVCTDCPYNIKGNSCQHHMLYDAVDYVNSLKEEIKNLTAAKEAAERDKANLERTIEEIYEALHVQGITLDCDGNVVPANKTINKYERLTPKDKIEVINVNHGDDMTRLILYAFNLWALENMLESGELIKVRKKEINGNE